MAIGRISGPMLKNDLTRQGVDLSFEGNLLYLDVTNLRIGINKSSPSNALSVLGNIDANNLSVVSNVYSNGLYDGSLRALTQITNGGGVTATIIGNTITLGASDFADTTDIAKGDALIGFKQANATSSYTDAVASTVHSKLRDFVSTRDFGAVCDGITNDAAALISALATGKQVFVVKGSYFSLSNAQAQAFIAGLERVSPEEGTDFNLPGSEISLSTSVNVYNPDAVKIRIVGQNFTSVSVSAVSAVSGSAKDLRIKYTVTDSSNIAVNDYVIIAASSGTGNYRVVEGCFKVTAKSGNDITVKHTMNAAWPSSDFTFSSATCYPIKTVLRWPLNSAGLRVGGCSLGQIKNLIIAGSFDISSSPAADSAGDGLQIGSAPDTYVTGLNESEQLNAGSVWAQKVGFVEWQGNGVQAAGGNFYGSLISACSNGWRGFQSARAGSVEAKFSSAVGNGASGYEAEAQGWMNADASVASGNQQQGYYSIGGGTVLVGSGHAIYNQTGIDARNYAIALCDGAYVRNNSVYGLYCNAGSILFGVNASTSTNGTQDIYVGEGGVVDANGGLSIGTTRIIYHDSGARLIDTDGELIYPQTTYLENSDGEKVQFNLSSITDLSLSFDATGGGSFTQRMVIKNDGTVYPSVDGGPNLGRSGNRWGAVYTSDGLFDGNLRAITQITNGGSITATISGNTITLGSTSNTANSASTLVARDAAGNFTANVITANNGFLDGTLRAVTQVTPTGGISASISGNTLSISVNAGATVNSVSNGGGVTGYITGSGALTLGSNGSSANGASTIVTRGADGSFTANIITANNGFLDGANRTIALVTNGGGVTGTISGNTLTLGINGPFANSVVNASGLTGYITGAGALTLGAGPAAFANSVVNNTHITAYITNSGALTLGSTSNTANSASSLVARDAAGNFAANVITANNGFLDGTLRAITQVSNSGGVTGTITGNTLTVGINGPYANSVVNASGINAYITSAGALTLSVAAGAIVNSVTNGGGITGTISGSGALTLGSTANSSNSASTIVQRGADGSFTANIITANNGFLDGANRTLALVSNGGGVTGVISGNTLTLGATGFANSVVNAGGINGVISGAGVLTLSITPAAIVNSIVNGGGITGTISATGALTLNSNGSSSNGASTIVTRDAAGNFTSNVITASNGFFDGTLRTLTKVTNGGGVTGTVSGNTLTLGAVGFANSVVNSNGIQGTISGAGVLTLVVAPGSIANSVSNGGGITGFITNSGVLTLNSNANSSNSASTIVQRDGAGNFTANVITANNGFLDGTLRALTQVTPTSGINASISGNTISIGVNAGAIANSVTNGGGITGYITSAGALTLGSNGSSSNGASTIVTRGADGSFAANIITATLYGAANTATSATTAGTVTTNAQSNITSVGTLLALTSSGVVSITNSTTAVNTTSGALTVTGGIGIGGNLYVGGPNSTIYGNLTVGNLKVTGNTTTIGSVDLAVADSIINLHTPADLSPLTADDLRDIGIAFHYFKTQEDHAFLGWANDSGYLEWYDSGTEVGNVFTGNSYGTIKTGGMILVNNTPATNTTTGTLTVVGGISSQGNIYGAALYDGTNRVLTTANHIFANINANSTFINSTTSTDTLTFVPGSTNVTITANAITKTITIDAVAGAGASTDNLQNVTTRGATTANTIVITNAAAATNTTTGALQVTGGISTQNVVYAAGGLFDGSSRTLAAVTNGGGVTGTITGNTLTLGASGFANSVTNGGGITGTISAGGVLTLNSNANSSNSASTIVQRDAAGNFTANVITASNGHFDGTLRTLAQVTNGGGVTGTVSGNTLTLGAVGFANSVVNAGGINGVISGAGVLTLSITPAAIVNSVVNGGGVTGTISATGALTLGSTGSSANGASTIVTRDAAGNFTANVITASNGHFDGTLRTLAQVTNGGGVTGTISGNTLTLGATGFANSVTNGGGITGTISTGGVLTLNSNANASNSASTIVTRGADGSFAANIITATLYGAANTATSATTAGTVTTNAQPNITSVGTLTALTSSGLVSITNATAATNTTTGALQVTGGISTQNTMYAAGGHFDGANRTLALVTNGGGVTGTISGNTLTLGAIGFANSVVNASGINGTISGAGVLTLSVSAGAFANSVTNGGGITGTISGSGALILGSNANSSNSASTIVQRNAAGNFAANAITANNGFFDGVLRAVTQVTPTGGVSASISGNTLSISVNAGSSVNSVSNGGGVTGFITGAGVLQLGSNATSSNVSNAIVSRDTAGNFTANVITASNGFFDGTLRTLTQVTNGGGVTGTTSGNTITLGAVGFANSVVNAGGINGVISGAGVLTLSVTAGGIVNSIVNGGGVTGTISATGALTLGSTANSSNSASTIVQRDAAGNFTANLITANNGFLDGANRTLALVTNGGGVTGTVSGNTLTLGATGFANSVVNASGINGTISGAGVLTLSVSAGAFANSVTNGGGITGTISGSGALILGSNANSSNSASTIVQRGADGSFTANIITANNGFLDGTNRTLALVTNGGGITGTVSGNTITLGSNATSSNVSNAIVSRDTSGSFAANVVTASRVNVTSTTGTSSVTSGALVVAGGVGIAGEIWVGTPTGDEGGQLNLALAATNTTLNTSVVIDVYQNKLRIFEGGGTARGVYVDLSAAAAGVGTNLVGSGGAGGGLAGVSNGGGITGYVTSNILYLGSNATSSNVSNAIVSRDTAGSFTGNVITGDTFVSLNNGAGTNFKVGDDAWIGDINTADTMSIRGQQNAANGYIIFGNADSTATLGRAGSGPLTYIGNANVTANLTAGNANVRGIVTVTGNITAGNANITGTVTVTGNITAGNIIAGGARSTTSATAPTNPTVGDMWYDSDTDVLYRYTYDGTSYFWLDIAGAAGGSPNTTTLGNATVSSGNITIVTPNVATQVQTLSASTYKTLRYTIQAAQGTDNLQIDDVVLGVINNTVALGQVTFLNPTTGDMVTYTANIQSSNVYLYANVTSANTVITYVRTAING